jgi:hypothetical protein
LYNYDEKISQIFIYNIFTPQKVEDASSMAAAAAFGTPYISKARLNGQKEAKERIIDTHIHEAAYAEG